jgi:hypothetical protein
LSEKEQIEKEDVFVDGATLFVAVDLSMKKWYLMV